MHGVGGPERPDSDSGAKLAAFGRNLGVSCNRFFKKISTLTSFPGHKKLEAVSDFTKKTVANSVTTLATNVTETIGKVRDVVSSVLPALSTLAGSTWSVCAELASSIISNIADSPPLRLVQKGNEEKKVDKQIINQEWVEADISETITRIPTLSVLRESAMEEIKYLQKNFPGDKKIGRLQQMIDNIDSNAGKKDWVSSDAFRDDLRQLRDIRSDRQPDAMERINTWQKQMQGYYQQPVPVNMRYHTCKSNEGENGWLRLGVISDKSNGFINYEQLQAASTDEGAWLKMAQEVVQTWAEAKKQGNKNVDASAGYALRQLGFTDEVLKSVCKKIENGERVDLKNRVTFGDAQKVMKQTLDQRKEVLERQFLLVVQEHVAKAGTIEGDTFRMMHVGLLNHHSKTVDSSGWYHNEENEMLDMAAIFNHFDKVKIIFGTDGPFIDNDGNIHLKNEQMKGKDVVLRALFVNQSVQGYTKNDGVQLVLNKRAEIKMQEMHGLDALCEILNKSKSNYSTAADMIAAAKKAGFHVSTGCESAKDRTGFVSALVAVMRFAPKSVDESVKRKIMRKQLEEGSPAVQVVMDNTGTKIVKVLPFVLEGVSDKYDLRGVSFRLKMYVNQLFEIKAERDRINKKRRVAKQNVQQRLP